MAWLVAPLAAALVTEAARRYALRRGLLDAPGARRSHVLPTPRGGGIGPVSVLAALFAMALPATRWPIVAGLLLVAGVGALDDHRPLGAGIRLAVHVVAGVGLAWGLGLPVVPALVLAVSAVVAINAWNFMDGINGIATLVAVATATTVAVIGPMHELGATAALAIAAFLPFNFPRARIFLGDVGSGAVGYAMVALVGLQADAQGAPASWALFPVAGFLVDTGLTLLMRMLRGERWWTAHTQHAYQVLARAHGHTPVAIGYAVHAAAGGALAIGLDGAGSVVMMASLAAWYTATALAWCMARRTRSGPNVANTDR